MAGKLTVNQTTHNKLSVTWKLKNSTIADSTTVLCLLRFSLLTDGHFVHFSSSIDCTSGYKLMIKQAMPQPGRAIVTLSLDRPQTPVIFRRHLLESWRGDYVFDCPGESPKSVEASVHQRISLYVIIKLDITWLGFLNVRNVPRSLHVPKELCLQSIPYSNEVMPDVKLIIGDKELPAQKNILALHSPIFLGMFEASMKESQENRVVIEDVDFATLNTLIGIIYSGDTQELHNVRAALKVLAVAEKYQILTIKKACEYKLRLNVKNNNVLQLLEEADKYNAGELLQLCVEYIIVAKNVIPSGKFKEMCLKKPTLSAALINTQFEKLYAIPCNKVQDIYKN